MIAKVSEEAAVEKLPISPLVGEMSGRTEGGAVPQAFPSLPSPLHLPGRHALACRGILAVLELDTLREQFVADLVRFRPVFFANEGEALRAIVGQSAMLTPL